MSEDQFEDASIGDEDGYLSPAGSEYEYHDSYDEYDGGTSSSPKGVNLSLSLTSSKVLSRSEVEEGYRMQIYRCAETCNVPTPVAAVLLREFRFNHQSVTENYYNDPEAVLSKLKISVEPCKFCTGSKEINLNCSICCDDKAGDVMVHMGCGHYFCRDCYNMQISGKIDESDVFAALKCMEPNCNRLAGEEFLDQLLDASSEAKAKYNKFCIDTFVSENPSLAFCPNTLCNQVLQFPQGSGDLDVQCNCGCLFCVGCGGEGHAPCSCRNLRNWKSKDADESMTATWIKVNTKDCPKCTSQIEKNGGCNHMTCKKCRHEFCWLCAKDWRGHAACNAFPAEGIQSETRAELERYTFYWERFYAHVQSLKFEEKHLADARKRADEMMKANAKIFKGDITESDYIIKAAKTLTKCRRVLKYTYVYAFYIPDKMEKELFEHIQAVLESSTEKLARLIEDPKAQRFDVVCQEGTTAIRLQNLLSGAAVGIMDTGGAEMPTNSKSIDLRSKSAGDEPKRKIPRNSTVAETVSGFVSAAEAPSSSHSLRSASTRMPPGSSKILARGAGGAGSSMATSIDLTGQSSDEQDSEQEQEQDQDQEQEQELDEAAAIRRAIAISLREHEGHELAMALAITANTDPAAAAGRVAADPIDGNGAASASAAASNQDTSAEWAIQGAIRKGGTT